MRDDGSVAENPYLDRAAPEPVPRDRELCRSRGGRVLAGVCAGLGRHTDIDPLVYRVTFALLTVGAGVGVALYLLAWLLIPAEYAAASPAERVLRRRIDPRVVFPAFLVILVLFFAATIAGGGIGRFIVLAVLLVGVLTARARGIDVIATVRTMPAGFGRRQPPPPPRPYPQPMPGTAGSWWSAPAAPVDKPPDASSDAPPGRPAAPDAHPLPVSQDVPAEHVRRRPRRPSRLTLLTLAAAVAVAGVVAVLGGAGGVSAPLPLALAAALITIGLGITLGTWFGRGPTLLLAGLLVSAALVATTIDGEAGSPLRGGYGDVTWRPTSAREAAGPYRLGTGDGTLILTALPPSRDAYDVGARVSVGELRVVVPRDATVRVDASVGTGSVAVPGRAPSDPPREEGGTPVRTTEVIPPATGTTGTGEKETQMRVNLTLRVRIGSVVVVRAPA